ncbi:hypothetical protein EVAR_98484_1 [Eumeta japonica]|uniref:Uncharacterized protein n=1 Tax=Eumeta variegata TaxID=151549 RepID=A0A4C1YJN9_EUMVA|nr:hypothetical protein EVAR_98484_1 [Eumeta japonica]
MQFLPTLRSKIGKSTEKNQTITSTSVPGVLKLSVHVPTTLSHDINARSAQYFKSRSFDGEVEHREETNVHVFGRLLKPAEAFEASDKRRPEWGLWPNYPLLKADPSPVGHQMGYTSGFVANLL